MLWKASTLPGGQAFGHYEVQFSTNKTFSDPNALCFDDISVTTLNDTALTTASLDTTNPLAAGTLGLPSNCPLWLDPDYSQNSLPVARTFYWRIRAVNDGTPSTFYSDWSAPFVLRTPFFRVDCASPYSPTDTTTLGPTTAPPYPNDNQVTFSWTSVTGAGSYTLQIARSPTFSPNYNIVATINGVIQGTTPPNTTYTLTKLLLPINTTLYWRVKVSGPYNYSPSQWWSCTPSFTTDDPPSAVKPLSPGSGTVLHNPNPTLTWSVTTTPFAWTFDHYELQVSPDPKYGTVYEYDNPAGASQFSPSQMLVTALLPGYKYYWRVRACDAEPACSNWSVSNSFIYTP